MRKIINAKNIWIFIFITFVFSVIYISTRIATAPSIAPDFDISVRVKSDYILMIAECAFGMIAMLLPPFLKQKINLDIPSAMLVFYAGFIYCAIYLGDIRNFYYIIPHWDTVLHTFSGAALGALGFSIISLLNKSKSISFSLSPIFVALFAFCFAISIGVIWEIIEFAIDYSLHTNMQRYALVNNDPLIGQAALTDTMKDLIVDSVGAFVVSSIGYISMRTKHGWLEQMQLKYK